MSVYSVRGLTAATVAANDAIASLWNPSSVLKIKLIELGFWMITTPAGSTVYIPRITTRGTPGSTIIPDADNDWEANAAPPSGALLDLAQYTIQPTREIPSAMGLRVSGATGSAGWGWNWSNPDGREINPGTGISLVSGAAFPISEVYFVWDETP